MSEYIPWYRPIRLARKTDKGSEFIGWLWRQKAFTVNNLHHGKIAFLEDQTPENLNKETCPLCKKSWSK